MSNLNYTTIHHETKKALGLTANEYMIADLIYNLQNNQKSKFPGWCYATKDYMANFFGFSRNGVQKIIGRLLSLGLIERGEKDGMLKTSQEWYEKVVCINENEDRIQSGHAQGSDRIQREHEVHTTGARSAYNGSTKPGYDNYSNNNTNNSKESKKNPSGSLGDKEKSLPAKLKNTIGYLSSVPEEDILHWIEKFPVLSREIIIREAGKAKAWTEANGKKKKDYQAFLRNWLDNTAERLEKNKTYGRPRYVEQE